MPQHRPPRLAQGGIDRRARRDARGGGHRGPGVEGRNATHQIKKLTKAQLIDLRDRLFLHNEIPDSAFDNDGLPYYRPAEDSIEYQYMPG